MADGLSDIDPEWVGGQTLPAWFLRALEVPREEGFVDVDGVPMHFFEWGDPAAPPVLMAHGFLSHARSFAFIAPYLSQDFRVVAYDLSGMGDSGVRVDCSIKNRAEEMIGVARALGMLDGPQKPIVVGHSFGAKVALNALGHAPEALMGAVICDLMVLRSSALDEFWSGERTSPGSGDPNRPHRRYPDYARARSRYVLSPPQPVGQPFLLDYMSYHSLRRDGDALVWKFSPEVFRRESERDQWRTIAERLVSTPGRKAIIYGENSGLFTPDSVSYVRQLGGSRIPMIGIPEAHHHLMLDEPLAFVTALRAQLYAWTGRTG